MEDNTEMLSQSEIGHMRRTIDSLSELLSEEVALLQKMSISKLPDLQQRKMELIEILEGYKARIRIYSDQSIPSAHKRELQSLLSHAQNMEEVIEEERKQLLKARNVHGILMKAVRSSIQKHLSSSQPYTPNGKQDDVTKRNHYSASLSVNESA